MQTAERTVIQIPVNPKFAKQQLALRQIPTAAYARVSTEQEEQQSSYEAQISYYTDKIMRNPDWSLVKIYSDEGISGTQAKNRPGFMKMIEDCKKGKIKQILVKSISRFARNTLESIHYIRMLKELEIAVIFEKERINTMDIDSETFITLQSCMAQAESESISGNIKWGYRRAFAQGKVIYNFKHWYGYEKGMDGQPVIVPEQADIVRRIFAEYLNGHSYTQIANGLMEQGIPRKNGKLEWHISTIQGMLKNERYCGDAISQKTYTKDCLTKKVVKNNGEVPMYYVTDAHPAIIERTLYNRVQEEMARRSGKRAKIEKPNTTGKAKHSGKYALSDILVCGECGTAYRRVTWSKNGKKTIVWRCLSRLTYGTKYCKNSPTIREDVLHEKIMEAIREHLSDREYLLEMLKCNLDIAMAEAGSMESTALLEKQIAELDKQMTELTGNISVDELDGMVETFAKISGDIQNLKNRRDEIQQKGKDLMCSVGDMEDAYSSLEIMPLDLNAYNDLLVRRIIDTIKLNEEILVIFKHNVHETR